MKEEKKKQKILLLFSFKSNPLILRIVKFIYNPSHQNFTTMVVGPDSFTAEEKIFIKSSTFLGS